MAGSVLTTSAFIRLGHYDSSPGNGAYCYAGLTVSSLADAETIASTHCAYPRRNGQAELAWWLVGWLHTEVICPPEDRQPSQY